jgi:hypothetical protein
MLFRVVIKDYDTREIIYDGMHEKGETINYPNGYEILYDETNLMNETYYYVRQITLRGKGLE